MMDRVKEPLAAFIRSVLHRVDYLAHYPCKVTSQNSDGTLELVPDSGVLIPSVSKVPIRHGVPGMTVKVASGSRVLLAFEGGDSTKPVAALWESATVTEIVFNGNVIKLKNGGTPVAKEGSQTTGHTHTITGTAGPYPIAATIVTATDSIATGQGSADVKVP